MSEGAPKSARRRGALAALPLIAFAALAALLFVRLFAGDASRIPSALIGQSAPALDLPGLDGAPGLADADLRQGHVTLVNVFASWCAPCHDEHEFLMALAADPALKAKGVEIFGVAQKDAPENIRRFLGAGGDPYAKVGIDRRRPRRHRLGRLRRSRDLHRQGRRRHRLQAGRPDRRRYAGKRRQAGNSQGDELKAPLSSARAGPRGCRARRRGWRRRRRLRPRRPCGSSRP